VQTIPAPTKPWWDSFTDAGPHVVYHLAGLLPGVDPVERTAHLYVGVTNNVPQRMRAHSRKWWWPLVVPELCEFSEHQTRDEAEAHERDMIRWYQPEVNRAGRLLVVTTV
jgi:hypothetical protein